MEKWMYQARPVGHCKCECGLMAVHALECEASIMTSDTESLDRINVHAPFRRCSCMVVRLQAVCLDRLGGS